MRAGTATLNYVKQIQVCYRIIYRAVKVTKQYKFGTGVSWEANRRSDVALAMRHR